MVTLCFESKKIVNKRQEALLCDGCNKWQHRTCRSGVSRGMYRNAVKSGEDITWRCKTGPPCTINFVCLQTTVVAWFSFRPPFHQRSLTGHREQIKLWNPHFSNLLPWVPEFFLARFPVSFMSVYGDPRSEVFRSTVREKTSGTQGMNLPITPVNVKSFPSSIKSC